MKKMLLQRLLLPLTVSIGLASQAHAGLENFEYTVEDISGDGTQFEYNMQFWIDLDDPDYTSTLGYNQIRINIGDVNEGDGRGPRPFGNGFITDVQSGFVATDQTSRPNFTAIQVDAPGFNFWEPTADDFFIRFTGVSSVLADMTWNYFGRRDVDDFASAFSGAGTTGRFMSLPVDALTDFSPPPPPPPPTGNPARVPTPASLPLLLAGLGGFLLRRRTGSQLAC